jgi:hypothetical protein
MKNIGLFKNTVLDLTHPSMRQSTSHILTQLDRSIGA